MNDLFAPIATPRCSLEVLPEAQLVSMAEFIEPEHLHLWIERARADARNVAWGPRAILEAHREMVGHAGFHLPPQTLQRALRDPTFTGRRDPVTGGVVEIGYTVFAEHRGQGYATETVAALVDWAARTGEVGAVIASIDVENEASQRVLARVGGFAEIGTCRGDGATEEIVLRRDLA